MFASLQQFEVWLCFCLSQSGTSWLQENMTATVGTAVSTHLASAQQVVQRLRKVLSQLDAAAVTVKSYSDNGYVAKGNGGGEGAAAKGAATDGAVEKKAGAATLLTWEVACNIIKASHKLAHQLASKYVDMWKARDLAQCFGVAAAASGKLLLRESSM